MKSLILALIYLSFAATSIAQTLPFPKEIVYYKVSLDTTEDSDEDDQRYTETRSFHPIGWSADGKFAYAAFYDGYSEGLSIDVIVKDMVTDKIVWETNASGYDAEKDIQNDIDCQGLWKKVLSKTEKALAKYKIKQETKIDYRKESWHRINGQEYKFALTAKDKIQIDCRAKGLGTKTVYKQNISADNFEYQFGYGAEAYYVAGIIKSPYEDRVIVVYHLMEKGFEFIDNEYYGLVGCQLLTGFK